MSLRPPPLPTTWRRRIDTKSLDEAQQIYSARSTPVRLERIGRRTAFAWRSSYAALGPLGISTSWFGASFAAHTDAIGDVFALAIPLSDGCETVHADGPVPMSAGKSAALSSPGASVSARIHAGWSSVEILLARTFVEEALVSLTGTPSRTPLRFEPRVSLAAGAGAAVGRMASFIVDELRHDDGALTSPLVAARLVDALVFSLLSGQPHNHAALLAAQRRSAEPAHVRRVAEYLEAHAEEPVRLADLAAVAGVSVRAIQMGFRAHRGCSPTEFLRQRRLELARTRLLSWPAATVAEIALQCGFEHFGRFSALYRARFGETPAETLRRTRGA
jgi:AraC-like DNA-binding protein